MNELIPVHKNIIGKELINGCVGRRLHEFLEVQTVYTTWFYRRIEEYGFIEGQDFLSTLEESTGGRPEVNHFISIDMAKELSMVEKTAKGKEARQYFIACEKALLDSSQDINRAILTRLHELESKIDQISPKTPPKQKRGKQRRILVYNPPEDTRIVLSEENIAAFAIIFKEAARIAVKLGHKPSRRTIRYRRGYLKRLNHEDFTKLIKYMIERNEIREVHGKRVTLYYIIEPDSGYSDPVSYPV